jgi:MFS family permease
VSIAGLPDRRVEALLQTRLDQLRHASGLPVLLAGTTTRGPGGRGLRITQLVGTLGRSPFGLEITPGRGLGGTVVSRAVPCRVNDSAPIILVVLRFAQGFAVGGEWAGATLLTAEYAPKDKRGFYGVFPQLGPAIAFALSSATFLATNLIMGDSDDAFLSYGVADPVPAVVPAGGCRPLRPAPHRRDAGVHGSPGHHARPRLPGRRSSRCCAASRARSCSPRAR